MKGIIVLAFCAVYSVEAWNEILGPLNIESHTGHVPEKYLPLSAEDKHAIRKAASFVGFIKHMPQVNPLQLPSMGPYHISMPENNIEGNLILSNVVVNGIKNLALNDLEMRMATTRVDFNVSLPEVAASGDFQLSGVYGGQPMDVNGHVSVILKDLIAVIGEGNKLAQVAGLNVYQIDSGDIKIHIGSAQVSMNMNQYSDQFRAYAVNFLKNTAQYPDTVDNIVRNVLAAVSVELAKFPAEELLNYLISNGKPPQLFARY
uniref:Hemolymph juvenile hormone binding protein n=1 Tax=Heliothis virescens TaxID=7102 RepID=A0A2A4JC80_HELVI